MFQILSGLFLSGVLGYIPYKYLSFIGLVSEKNKTINTPALLLFSVETFLIWYITFALFLGNQGINHLNTINPWKLLIATIIFLIVFALMIFGINVIVIKNIIKLINRTRKKLDLDDMSLLDKRDKLFNNNRNPVYVVVYDFDDKIIKQGELMAYNSSTSDFDLLEIKYQGFNVFNLPDEDELWEKHSLIDLKQQIKIDLYLMNES